MSFIEHSSAMGWSLARVALSLVGLVLLRFLYGTVREEIVFRLAKRRTGCVRARSYPHTHLLGGTDLVQIRAEARKQGSILKLYDGQFDKLGDTWQETLYHERIINTRDPKNMKHVCATESDIFGRNPRRVRASLPIFGMGILNADGPKWRHARDTLKPAFMRSEVGNLRLFTKHVDRFIAGLPRDGKTMDIEPVLKKLFMDSSTEFLFGESTDFQLSETSAEGTAFLKSLDVSLAGLGKRLSAGLSYLRFYFDKEWWSAINDLYRFVDARVATVLADIAAIDHHEKKNTSLLPSKQTLLHEMARQIRDPVELRFQILNVFLPARDTTAVLVSNTLFLIARRPSIWRDLRSYVLSLPETWTPSFESLKTLRPIQHAMNEAFRLVGPGGRSWRYALRDSVLPRGGGPDGQSPVFVPKGTSIAMITLSMHHDQKIWGDDAEQFRPERWEEERIKKDPVKWEFIPFLGGPGICPAQQLAISQATYVLWRLLMEFERIENRDPEEEFKEALMMLIDSRNGCKVALFPSA